MTARWALITGASAGLGREFARQIAAAGNNVILVARRREPMAELGQALSQEHGVEYAVIAADLADELAPERIHQKVRALNVDVDILVNNAGTSPPDLLVDNDWQTHRAYLDLMMISVAALCHRLIPSMRSRGYGRVINVASVAGLITAAGDYSYGPTKSYLVALSKALHMSLSGEGVHVTALCPGFTHTDFHASPELTAMKEGMPKFLWYDADVVVRDGLEAVELGKPVCVSGRLYKLIVPLVNSFAGQWLIRKMGVRRGLK